METTKVVEHTATTTDKANRGFADAEVKEDPKSYPKADDALIDELEANTSKEVNTFVTAAVEDFAGRGPQRRGRPAR